MHPETSLLATQGTRPPQTRVEAEHQRTPISPWIYRGVLSNSCLLVGKDKNVNGAQIPWYTPYEDDTTLRMENSY